jgi:hypothetical protein
MVFDFLFTFALTFNYNMLKLIALGAVLFFAYRLWIVPMLEAAKGEDTTPPKIKKEPDQKAKDDYIDYEEIK